MMNTAAASGICRPYRDDDDDPRRQAEDDGFSDGGGVVPSETGLGRPGAVAQRPSAETRRSSHEKTIRWMCSGMAPSPAAASSYPPSSLSFSSSPCSSVTASPASAFRLTAGFVSGANLTSASASAFLETLLSPGNSNENRNVPTRGGDDLTSDPSCPGYAFVDDEEDNDPGKGAPSNTGVISSPRGFNSQDLTPSADTRMGRNKSNRSGGGRDSKAEKEGGGDTNNHNNGDRKGEDDLSAESTTSERTSSDPILPREHHGKVGGAPTTTNSGDDDDDDDDELLELLARMRRSRILLGQISVPHHRAIMSTTENFPSLRVVNSLPRIVSSSSSLSHLRFPRPTRWFTPLPPLFDDDDEDKEEEAEIREDCVGRQATDRGSVTSMETDDADYLGTAAATMQPFEVWRIHASVDTRRPWKRLCFRLWQAQEHDLQLQGAGSLQWYRLRGLRGGHPFKDASSNDDDVTVVATRDVDVVREWVRQLRLAAAKSGRKIVILVTSQDRKTQKHPGFQEASRLVLDPTSHSSVEDAIPEPASHRFQLRGMLSRFRAPKAQHGDQKDGSVVSAAKKKAHIPSDTQPNVVAKKQKRHTKMDGILCWKRRSDPRPYSPDLFSAIATVASC